jgi:SAM-dependent methyltransferase
VPGLQADYDVFLSYNSADRDFATDLADALISLGVQVWIDQYALLPGDDFQGAIQEALRSVKAVVVLFGGRGVGPWEHVEMRAALIESVRRGITVIPIVIPGAGQDLSLPLFLEPFSKVDMRDGLSEASLLRVQAAIMQRSARPSPLGKRGIPRPLRDVIADARQWIVFSGFRLAQLAGSARLRDAILTVLHDGVRVTLLQVNPGSAAAGIRESLEDGSSSGFRIAAEYAAMGFFREAFEELPSSLRRNLEVLFVNYCPHPLSIIRDQSVFVYLQPQSAVPDYADLHLPDGGEASDEPLRRRLHEAILAPLEAADCNPFIRYGQVYEHVGSSKLAGWETWSPAERLRRSRTHEFYVRYASDFHARFGWDVEREVGAYLDLLDGPALVLGCGSGKEVGWMAKRRPTARIEGLDVSPIAIDIARQRFQGRPSIRFTVGDFYDLDHLYAEQFAGVVANAAFVHLLQREDIDGMLARVHRRLLPGGLFFVRALYKEDEHGQVIEEEMHLGNDDRWNAQRWFVYYSAHELAERLHGQGFIVLEEETRSIARSERGASDSFFELVRSKGFPHLSYHGVYWPTLIARKV